MRAKKTLFVAAAIAASKWFLCHKHRERRLKAGKMLQWSILSESPSNYVAKAT